MPIVMSEEALAKAYWAAKKKIDAGDIPTLPLYPKQTLYRSIDPTKSYTYLPKPANGQPVSRMLADKMLSPGDGMREGVMNRFSGLPLAEGHPGVVTSASYGPPGSAPGSATRGIPAAGGLYCVLQQQALVNEAAHYSRKVPVWSLANRCVLKIRLTTLMQVADLSPHNPRALRFLRELGVGTWEEMTDPKDCSVARGIGLAVAQSSFLAGLAVQTVRSSERSEEERGDNLVLYGPQGKMIPGIQVEEVYFFGKTYEPEVFPVA